MYEVKLGLYRFGKGKLAQRETRGKKRVLFSR